MNLETLLAAVRRESEERRSKDSLKSLKARIGDLPAARGFARQIGAASFSLIAEVKIKSPSMGLMGVRAAEQFADVHRIYDGHPAVSALSVLTQHEHFGGTPALFRKIHREVRKPVLRKDFIIDEYEVYYTRSIGADAMLLMANVVTDKERFRGLHDLALELGMDVLCEVHDEHELELLPPTAKLCGVNARSFTSEAKFRASRLSRLVGKDMTTDLGVFQLFSRLPRQCLKVAESGLNSKNIAGVLEKYAFDAALVGTSLLKGGNAEEELGRFKAAIEAARRPAPVAG